MRIGLCRQEGQPFFSLRWVGTQDGRWQHGDRPWGEGAVFPQLRLCPPPTCPLQALGWTPGPRVVWAPALHSGWVVEAQAGDGKAGSLGHPLPASGPQPRGSLPQDFSLWGMCELLLPLPTSRGCNIPGWLSQHLVRSPHRKPLSTMASVRTPMSSNTHTPAHQRVLFHVPSAGLKLMLEPPSHQLSHLPTCHGSPARPSCTCNLLLAPTSSIPVLPSCHHGPENCPEPVTPLHNLRSKVLGL